MKKTVWTSTSVFSSSGTRLLQQQIALQTEFLWQRWSHQQILGASDDVLTDQPSTPAEMSGISSSPDDPVIQILLMGRYGSGKSSSGNTIVGEKKFQIREHETKVCEGQTQISGKQVKLFISPDPLDSDLNEEQLENMKDKLVSRCSSGLSAVLLTVPLLEPVQNEEEMLDYIKCLFDPEVQKYMMILFTRGDELEELDQTIDEYLQKKCNADVQQLVTECGGMFHIFNNKSKSEKQKQELLLKIEAMMKKNGGKFTSKQMKRNESKRGHPITFSGESPAKIPNRTDLRLVLLGKTGSGKKVVQLPGKALTLTSEEGASATEGAESRGVDHFIPEMPAIGSSPDDPVIQILLMGRYGSGKSSSGNTIVGGEKKFQVREHETELCKGQTQISGKQVKLFISPDPLDPDLNEEQLDNMKDKLVSQCSSGLSAVLLTVSLLEPVQKEEEILDYIKCLFGPEVQKYMMILFTRGDELEELDQTIDEYLQKKCNADVQQLVTECGGRFHIFNNKSKSGKQKQELLLKIEAIMKKNGGKFTMKQMRRNENKRGPPVTFSGESPAKIPNRTDLRLRNSSQITEQNRRMKFNSALSVSGITLLYIAGCLCQLDVCGRARLKSKVFGGENARTKNWPWQVSIHYNYTHHCGGTLITKDWVLSAAHCFQDHDESDTVMYFGRLRQFGSNPYETNRTARRIIKHPKYDRFNGDNDIALVQLSSSVTFTERIKPVCLAAAGSVFAAGTQSWVTGWGSLQSEAKPFDLLQEMMVPVVNNSDCDNVYGGNITNNMICAGLLNQVEKGVCTGDSGGPVVSRKGFLWIQSGILSFGKECVNPKYPTVSTRVSQYQNWIKSYLGSNRPGFVAFNIN
ncbi:hypothetical protein Q8A67_001480 [Cirrhinus molitorella]|uniref:Uncharacterized protein n=1 Tax=Cirrhinus molitorella TaxID=172907 RepID=A0AA88QBJ9_9TELE|nr:hypothetical protein Q8A67_001480 [Cirrhinus molitorella]